jgi:hypothetical protein
MASIEIGQTFSSLATVKAAIKLAISEQREPFIIDYSDKTLSNYVPYENTI